MLVFVPVLLAISISNAKPTEGKRNFLPEDVLNISTLSNPKLSPGGKWLAYSYRKPNYENNNHDSGIYIVSTAGGEPRLIVEKGKASFLPEWHPTDERLGFISIGEKGSPQVFQYDPITEQVQQLTKIQQGLSAFSWGPKGRILALTIKDYKKIEGRWKGIKAPWVIDRQQFKADGVGYLNRQRSHIYIYDLKSQMLTQITKGDYDDSSATFSPDGQTIAFQSNRTQNPDANGDRDIWTVSVKGKKHPLTKISTSDDMDWSPVWSPDGRYIGYRTYLDPDKFYFSLRALALYDTKTATTKVLTKNLDRSVHRISFSADGKDLLFLFEDEGKYNLATISVKGGKHRLITRGNHFIVGYSQAKDGSMVVFKSEPDTPGSRYSSGDMFLLKKNGYKQLTFHNKQYFADIELSEPEMIWFDSPNGRKIQAWLYKPYAFDSKKTYPLVFDIHGGPIAQFGYRFDTMAQVLAGAGYFVVLPNISGSSGYGRDFQLDNANYGNFQGLEDIIAGAEYLAKRPYIDRDRMAVQGWSYGGSVTNHMITRKPGAFAAAISGAGRSSYMADYGTDQYQAMIEKAHGLLWENREKLESISAFNLAQFATTPTMFVCGEKDFNVPVTNSERMYQVMKRLGRETLLVVYPDQAHSITSPKYDQHRFKMYLKWYSKYLQ